MGKIKSRKFIYKNSVKWQEKKRGLLSSLDKSNIEVATPPEFRGHSGIWTPEDLFVAAVNSCIMTTFLHYAEKEGLKFLSYESEAEGVLERVNTQFTFSHITVRSKITVASGDQEQKTRELMKLSENGCLISNSIKSSVKVILEISASG